MSRTSLAYERPSRVAQGLVVGFSVAVVVMAGWLVMMTMFSHDANTKAADHTEAQPAPPRVEIRAPEPVRLSSIAPPAAEATPPPAVRAPASPWPDTPFPAVPPRAAPPPVSSAAAPPSMAPKVVAPQIVTPPTSRIAATQVAAPEVAPPRVAALAAPAPVAGPTFTTSSIAPAEAPISERVPIVEDSPSTAEIAVDTPPEAAPEVVPLPTPKPRRVASIPVPRPRPHLDSDDPPPERTFLDVLFNR